MNNLQNSNTPPQLGGELNQVGLVQKYINDAIDSNENWDDAKKASLKKTASAVITAGQVGLMAIPVGEAATAAGWILKGSLGLMKAGAGASVGGKIGQLIDGATNSKIPIAHDIGEFIGGLFAGGAANGIAKNLPKNLFSNKILNQAGSTVAGKVLFGGMSGAHAISAIPTILNKDTDTYTKIKEGAYLAMDAPVIFSGVNNAQAALKLKAAKASNLVGTLNPKVNTNEDYLRASLFDALYNENSFGGIRTHSSKGNLYSNRTINGASSAEKEKAVDFLMKEIIKGNGAPTMSATEISPQSFENLNALLKKKGVNLALNTSEKDTINALIRNFYKNNLSEGPVNTGADKIYDYYGVEKNLLHPENIISNIKNATVIGASKLASQSKAVQRGIIFPAASISRSPAVTNEVLLSNGKLAGVKTLKDYVKAAYDLEGEKWWKWPSLVADESRQMSPVAQVQNADGTYNFVGVKKATPEQFDSAKRIIGNYSGTSAVDITSPNVKKLLLEVEKTKSNPSIVRDIAKELGMEKWEVSHYLDRDDLTSFLYGLSNIGENGTPYMTGKERTKLEILFALDKRINPEAPLKTAIENSLNKNNIVKYWFTDDAYTPEGRIEGDFGKGFIHGRSEKELDRTFAGLTKPETAPKEIVDGLNANVLQDNYVSIGNQGTFEYSGGGTGNVTGFQQLFTIGSDGELYTCGTDVFEVNLANLKKSWRADSSSGASSGLGELLLKGAEKRKDLKKTPWQKVEIKADLFKNIFERKLGRELSSQEKGLLKEKLPEVFKEFFTDEAGGQADFLLAKLGIENTPENKSWLYENIFGRANTITANKSGSGILTTNFGSSNRGIHDEFRSYQEVSNGVLASSIADRRRQHSFSENKSSMIKPGGLTSEEREKALREAYAQSEKLLEERHKAFEKDFKERKLQVVELLGLSDSNELARFKIKQHGTKGYDKKGTFYKTQDGRVVYDNDPNYSKVIYEDQYILDPSTGEVFTEDFPNFKFIKDTVREVQGHISAEESYLTTSAIRREKESANENTKNSRMRNKHSYNIDDIKDPIHYKNEYNKAVKSLMAARDLLKNVH